MLTEGKKISMPLIAMALVMTLLVGCASLPGKLESSSNIIGTSKTSSMAISSSSVPETANVSDPERAILEKYTTQKIQYFDSFPLENGQKAAFAVAGIDVWYVTATEAQKLKSGIHLLPEDPYSAPVLWDVEDTIIFKCEDSNGGSSTKSYAWYVKSGKPIELPFTGTDLSYLEDGQFTTIGDDFDHVFENGKKAGGHTYRRYYLYWAGNGLKEYGGIKITQQRLLKVKGAAEILDILTSSGCAIDDIYYRANHVININYHTDDKLNGTFDNVTLLYQNGAVTPVPANTNIKGTKVESFNAKKLSDFSYGGIYPSALYPQIATYPTSF